MPNAHALDSNFQQHELKEQEEQEQDKEQEQEELEQQVQSSEPEEEQQHTQENEKLEGDHPRSPKTILCPVPQGIAVWNADLSQEGQTYFHSAS